MRTLGTHVKENVRPAAEICAPGAECKVYFEHCTSEVTGGQIWHNYIGPKIENPKFV